MFTYLQLSLQFPGNYSLVMRDFRMNNKEVNECSMYVAVPAICYMFILGVSTQMESVLQCHTVSEYRSTKRNSAFTYTYGYLGWVTLVFYAEAGINCCTNLRWEAVLRALCLSFIVGIFYLNDLLKFWCWFFSLVGINSELLCLQRNLLIKCRRSRLC